MQFRQKTRPRDRASAEGLLHRMEARPRKDGSAAYRYHPVGKKPIALGDDKAIAIQKVLDMNKTVATNGNLNSLWAMYQVTPEFNALSENSKTDYRQSSKQLLERLGLVTAADITPVVCARYLRVERTSSPVRANREMALLSNLMNLAVERGEIPANPCKQIRRNKERPRVDAPEVIEKLKADCVRWITEVPNWKDSSSLKFGTIRRGVPETRTVDGTTRTVRPYIGMVNGKNSYGAYNGEKVFACYANIDETKIIDVHLPS